MAEQNYKRKWNVADFESYHAGKMPAEEMYALEKQALDDAFLADALDGYEYTTTPLKDIKALQLQLNQKEKTKNVRWYKSTVYSKVFRVAAAIIILFGFSWIIYQKQEDKVVKIASVKSGTAARKTNLVIDKDFAQSLTAPMQVPLKSGNPVSATNKETNNQILVPDKSKTEFVTKSAGKELINVQSGISEIKALEAIRKNQDNNFAKMQDVKGETDKLFQGRIVDNTGKPVPFAFIIDSNYNQNVFADSNGHFSLKNNRQNSSVAIKVNAAGYETANSALTFKNRDNKIILQNYDHPLAELIKNGNESTKQMMLTSSTKGLNNFGLAPLKNTVFFKNVVALGGDMHFESKLKNLFATQPRPDTTGQVIVIFDINSNGKPTAMVIKKPLSNITNKIAIRILEQLRMLRYTKKGVKAEAAFNF